MTRYFLVIALACAPLLDAEAARSDAKTEKQQAELDGKCEVARQEKLIPLRKQYVEECVEKKQRPDRESCERFYADFGNQAGGRAALFYDLPECVEAFEFRRSYRSAD